MGREKPISLFGDRWVSSVFGFAAEVEEGEWRVIVSHFRQLRWRVNRTKSKDGRWLWNGSRIRRGWIELPKDSPEGEESKG